MFVACSILQGIIHFDMYSVEIRIRFAGKWGEWCIIAERKGLEC